MERHIPEPEKGGIDPVSFDSTLLARPKHDHAHGPPEYEATTLPGRYELPMEFAGCRKIVYFVYDILVSGVKMSTPTHGQPRNSATDISQMAAIRQLVQNGPVNVIGAKGRKLTLPPVVTTLLDEILKNLQAGTRVSVIPEQQQLTTQHAANVLGVSRPFLVRLLEDGNLPFHRAGTHRRIYLKDLLAYKKRRDRERHRSIVRMARMEVAAGTYDKVVLPEGAEER